MGKRLRTRAEKLDAAITCVLHGDLVVLLWEVDAIAGLQDLLFDTHGCSWG